MIGGVNVSAFGGQLVSGHLILDKIKKLAEFREFERSTNHIESHLMESQKEVFYE